MKNIIYLIFLIVSTSGFAQSSTIVNDELFLKYEKEYLKYLNNRDNQELQKLDKAEGAFYLMFKDQKGIKSFKKNKDQIKWLGKNLSKTNFSSVSEAQTSYADLYSMKQKQIEQGRSSSELLDELVKKYDPALIWKTLKSRLPK